MCLTFYWGGLSEQNALSPKDCGVSAVSIDQDWLRIIPASDKNNIAQRYPYEGCGII